MSHIYEHNIQAILDASKEEIRMNGGLIYILYDLKKAGVPYDILKNIAEHHARDDEEFLQRLLNHIRQ